MDDARYDEFAEYYDAFVGTSIYVENILPALWEFLPPVAGLRICDLACGQGVVSRGLVERGARVVGFDISRELLERGMRYETERPLGIEYRMGDAQHLQSVPDEAFDGVVCCMALMDIPDMPAVMREAARILTPGGWFVFAITHPCWEAPDGRWARDEGETPVRIAARYLSEGFWRAGNPEGLRYRVGAHHRTFSTYLNALSAAGFRFDRMAEPAGRGERLRYVPAATELPNFVLVAAHRPPSR